MVEGVQIKGGASEFEAAVVAVVLDQIARDEKSASEGRTKADSGLSAWVRAMYPEEPDQPRDLVFPD